MANKVLFISGWAGYPEFFPHLGSHSFFVLPFVSHSQSDIENLLRSHSWDIVLAWSLGANLCLQNPGSISTKHLVLIAPFLDFTRHTPVNGIQDMLNGLGRNPETTVRWFWRRCGIKSAPRIRQGDVRGLARGLEYLMQPGPEHIEHQDMQFCTTLIHGSRDRIVPRQALLEVHAALGQGRPVYTSGGHFIAEEKIWQITYEQTGTKIF